MGGWPHCSGVAARSDQSELEICVPGKIFKKCFFKEHLKILLFCKLYFIYEYTFPPLKIVVVVVVNLSCRNSHIITWFSRRNFNIVGFLAFKNAYYYTVGVEFSFFNAQPVQEWKLLHGQSVKECVFLVEEIHSYTSLLYTNNFLVFLHCKPSLVRFANLCIFQFS